ncbi:MAG: hypothetical protein QF436_00880 [Candidatus Woesearchaeota archaeon]|jgi:hypothetical protein|nr:hypothetical protein [archaeon]MDP6547518.1 hypothetical protein [Candidatus Woesearchaeota archaeon]MDP7262955.1 hypothetical protein [Candidatus Woesearchaeota archaeon]MDP7622649.1 hypothetical protein [Candidatus Woesearchaeota archaeon]HJN57264.1 hypothetical protein [Candidatus Woesearchaeota archaeon]|tara:strand:+ start:2084 stop:2731 length:648 start_codon:yes stop_codon:yes gene_type:complete
MKKLIVLLVMSLLALSAVFAASVGRDMPARVDPGAEVSITLTLNGAPAGEGVAIEDTIPNTISLKSWEISGSEEAKDDVSYATKASQKEGFDRHSWAFTASSGSPSITYKIDAPSAEGSHEFETRWITSEGFSKSSATLNVRTVTCGDGICEENENSDNCEADCPRAEAPAPTPVEEPKPVEAPGKSPTAWIIAAIVVIIGIALIVMYQKKKQQV